MRSSSSLLSAPPSPHLAPLPLSSSPMAHCPELDLSITLCPAPTTSCTHVKPRPLKMGQRSSQSQKKLRPQGQTQRKENTQFQKRRSVSGLLQVCFEEPVVVTVTPESHITLNRDALPQQQIRSQRRSGGHPHALRQWARSKTVDLATASNQDPGCLERAELNTTLALKAELQSLQGAEFNSQKVVQETLQSSERTKNLINTRATEVVNVSRSQLLFTSLVSIDMQEDQLINQLMQDRLLLVPLPRCHGNKAADAPSFVLFRTPDLVKQKPLPPEEPINYRPCPFTRPPYSTFDLYRRQRRWETTP